MHRLVEALEMYDNPHMDSYMSDEQDGSLGAGLGSIHPFGGIGLADDLDADDKALLGTKRKVWSNMPLDLVQYVRCTRLERLARQRHHECIAVLPRTLLSDSSFDIQTS